MIIESLALPDLANAAGPRPAPKPGGRWKREKEGDERKYVWKHIYVRCTETRAGECEMRAPSHSLEAQGEEEEGMEKNGNMGVWSVSVSLVVSIAWCFGCLG